MRPEKQKRIELNPAQSGLAGLGNALSNLSLGPLPEGPATPPAKPGKPAKKGRVILRKETAHRGGKTVTVIYDFPPSVNLDQMESLAKTLRQKIGTGGAVKDGTIEIQGEHAPKIRQLLEADGWTVAGI